MNSLITLESITVPVPSDDDKRADDQRIRDALGHEDLEIPLSVLRKIPSQTGSVLSCIVGRSRRGCKLIDISVSSSYSVALDLGSTNLAAVLYDNVSQRVVSEARAVNPQIKFGSDILTRMHHSMSGRAGEVCQCLMDGVDTVINDLCSNAGIQRSDIHALTAAGNTVMSHYFLGLDISRIPVSPFVPAVRKPGFFTASDLQIGVHPEALVYVFPNAGIYVGGDIVAGLLSSGIYSSEKPCILIDVGTNAEIVIGSRDWMLAGAGAAGPALEDGIAGIGKRAESGIIYDIDIQDGGISCRTFDNAPPRGICGSGMVSLMYELFHKGIIGSDGILNPGHKGVDTLRGRNVFAFSCGPGDRLVIEQTEIDNFLRSKAAMFTLLLVMLRSVGLQFGDIDKVYVAGALGNGINVRKAAGIGMLPDWSEEQIIPIGNSSLKGALMILQDSSLLEQEDEITDGITYKHMHDDPEFMKEFSGAIFIPHTNPGLLKIV
ncbi:MAG: ASKHA domain-containing protein [Nitrospirota bacterium]